MRIVLASLIFGATASSAALVPRKSESYLSPTIVSVADSSCVAALDSLQAIFRRDYPGYRDKVPGHERALAALTDSVRATARRSDHYSVCIPALKRWASFFRDPHVAIWQAAPPKPAPEQPAVVVSPGAVAADDPGLPSLRFVDDSTAVLRVPDLELDYKSAIDSLVATNRTRLLATPYLVVDVRGNAGGCTCSYASITPLLYTTPIREMGADVWATKGNAALYRGWLADDDVPANMKAQVRSLLPKMEAHPNQFVVWAKDTVVRLDTVFPMPRRVALLVDGKCASSCEDLVFETRQSRKVTVFGAENTAGVGDYGNVRKVRLPGWRQMVLPTTRSHRLPSHPIDLVGITPDVRITTSDARAVDFARSYLRSHRPGIRRD
jgi:hypothetical protein